MENLRLLEMRFSKTFNANPNVMSILSLVESHGDARFIDVNTSFERITGYQRDEIIGRFTTELGIWVAPEDLEKVRGMVLNQQEIRNLEINFRIKSGEIRVGLLSAETMEFAGDICLIVNVADITERKQIQKEMARLDRLNLVGEMAAGIGHEITTKENGTGLGLAVCYSIAARNNARIEVETGSTGTTFYVRFKIAF